MAYHEPVLLDRVVQELVSDPDGIYLDATAGGAGHSSALLESLSCRGTLWAVDRDPDAVDEVRSSLGGDRRVVVKRASFKELEDLIFDSSVDRFSGALFDLGVSSHQIDAPHRGFSYRADGPLDMRMEGGKGPSAADLIAEATEAELLQIVRDYGEERRAKSIVRTIVCQREEAPIETTNDLRRVVESTRPKMLHKTLARVFQAFRIAVNGELDQLAVGLQAATRHLCIGGRIAVIAYHSLEDRIVKQFMADRMRRCICPPRLPVCACDQKPEFCKVGRGRIRPTEKEIQNNSRARSAILRVYEKIEEQK